MLRGLNGQVKQLPIVGGRLLGYPGEGAAFAEHRETLAPGEAIVFFTDGLIEAREPGGNSLFGDDRLRGLVRSLENNHTLADWAEVVRDHVVRFHGG